jgi:putative component of membrane protein insertase Oxa1/YidC/SpoIIIJ protein YidD
MILIIELDISNGYKAIPTCSTFFIHDLTSDELKIKSLSDWFSIRKEEILCLHGDSLLKYHRNSTMEVLKSIHGIDLVLTACDEYWREKISHDKRLATLEFLEWIGDQLDLKSINNFYSIKAEGTCSYLPSISYFASKKIRRRGIRRNFFFDGVRRFLVEYVGIFLSKYGMASLEIWKTS